MAVEMEKIFKVAGFSSVDEKIKNDVERIIDWQKVLLTVDVDGVEPLYNTLHDEKFITNDDKAVCQNDAANNIEDVLKNAPEQEDNYFIVPKIIKQ